MGCVSLGSDIAWLHVCLYKEGFKKSKEYEEASERGLLPFCPNASVTLQSFGASDTREVAEVQTTFVQPIISVTLRTQQKSASHSQSPLSQCFCHEVDLIICVALFCVKWLSFTSFNEKSVCRKQTLQCYSSSYRAAISASAFFICSFTLSGPAMRTALPRLNIQPKNC